MYNFAVFNWNYAAFFLDDTNFHRKTGCHHLLLVTVVLAAKLSKRFECKITEKEGTPAESWQLAIVHSVDNAVHIMRIVSVEAKRFDKRHETRVVATFPDAIRCTTARSTCQNKPRLTGATSRLHSSFDDVYLSTKLINTLEV